MLLLSVMLLVFLNCGREREREREREKFEKCGKRRKKRENILWKRFKRNIGNDSRPCC